MKERIITIRPDEQVTIKVVPFENYSISEFARLSGLSRSTIYKKKKSGEIIFGGTEKSPKISHEQLIKFKKQ